MTCDGNRLEASLVRLAAGRRVTELMAVGSGMMSPKIIFFQKILVHVPLSPEHGLSCALSSYQPRKVYGRELYRGPHASFLGGEDLVTATAGNAALGLHAAVYTATFRP